jgi:D-cysteine desulfhydrase
VKRLATLPRERFATLPTPLQHAPRLSDSVGAPVYIKRDDLTGVGLGGNKLRKLEHLLADARAAGADTIITGGGVQSNHVALTALAAARTGLAAHIVCYGTPPSDPPAGNRSLVAMAGAAVTFTGDAARPSVDPALDDVAATLREQGRRPYVIPRGGATGLGSAGYVRACLELADQLDAFGVAPSHAVVATGSCGTQAGMEVGARALRASYAVVGVTVSRPADECRQRVRALAADCARLLDIDLEPVEATVLDGYLGPGYGRASAGGRSATELVARTEGLVLDPVFTAKAMAALVDLAATEKGPFVFWHTGGAPTAVLSTDLTP